jgi:phage gp46-like protein
MAGKRIELELPQELFTELERVASALGIGDAAEAATFGIAEWVLARRAELDSCDATQKYFVNEALDELIEKRRKR